jgi:nitroreductase
MPQTEALAARYGARDLAPNGPWNAVIEQLLSHRSVRAYLPDALPEGTAETLVAAAQSAASSSNLQLWDVIAVQDPARKERLSHLVGDQAHVREAPLFLVWLIDFNRAEAVAQAAGRTVEGLEYLETMIVGIADAALAAQNATVAAESLGLGAVYIGAIRNHIDQVAAELALPPKCFAVFGMCVGKPDPARPTEVKPRLPQSQVLHHEQYQPPSLDEIAAYDARMVEFQHGQGMKEIGWSRTVLSRLRDGAALSGRDNINDLLHAMGFQMR